MPVINFRILSTEQQRHEVEQDFRSMIEALGDSLDADFQVRSGLTPDPELVTTWVEQYGEATDPSGEQPVGAELSVAVRSYQLGSISGLTMNFAELLTTREKDPAEPLLRQVKDDAGTPRVPWHVEVRP